MIFNDFVFEIIRVNHIEIFKNICSIFKKGYRFEIYIPKIIIKYELVISLIVN